MEKGSGALGRAGTHIQAIHRDGVTLRFYDRYASKVALVDHARSRGTAKRGAQSERVPLDDIQLGAKTRGIEILALNNALESLAGSIPGKPA